MLVRSPLKLTVESLITAPRRSPGVSNGNGTHILYTLSRYNLVTKETTDEIQLMTVETGDITIFSSDPNIENAQWLGDSDSIVYERRNEHNDEATDIFIRPALAHPAKACRLGTIPVPYTDLQTALLDDDSVAIAFCAPIDDQGRLYNPAKVDRVETVREYESFPVRVFNSWNPTYQSSLHFTVATRHDNGKWHFGEFINAFKHSPVRYPVAPTAIWGQGGSYTLNKHGIVVSTLLPEQNLAKSWTFGMYTILLESWQENNAPILQIKVPDYVAGSLRDPSISPDGLHLVFTGQGKEDEFGQSKAYICYLPNWNASGKFDIELLSQTSLVPASGEIWDREASSLIWGGDSKSLSIIAQDGGNQLLFRLDDIGIFSPPRMPPVPTLVPHGPGSIISAAPLKRVEHRDSRLLIVSSSFVEASRYAVLDQSNGCIQEISHLTNNGADFGLSPDQVESVWFPGDQDYSVQAWIMRPSDFSPSKKYPLIIAGHGGPSEQAWNDAWSTRSNQAVYAEHGYVVVMPNFAGSPGFGYDFNWAAREYGGRPYRDIEQCFNWISQNLSYVDCSRSVFVGASYGGYMANWIQGQPLGKKLCAIVAHAGFCDMSSMISCDLIAEWDHQGRLWENPSAFHKWSPLTYAKNWSTPMLLLHGEKDYRVPLEQGIAAYQVCKARGIPARLVTFLEEGHLILKPENSLIWYRNVLEWIDKYTQV